MILLDTTRAAPDRNVIAWIAAQPRETLFTAGVVQTEILYGIALLPDGRRKSGLTAAVHATLAEDFAGRVLPFDGQAARFYAEIVVQRRASGAPIEAFDAMIAATARVPTSPS